MMLITIRLWTFKTINESFKFMPFGFTIYEQKYSQCVLEIIYLFIQ